MRATVERVPGVRGADLNFASGTLLVEYDVTTDPLGGVVRAVESTGHGVSSLDRAEGEEAAVELGWRDRYRAEIAAAGSGAFAVIGGVLEFVGAPRWAWVGAFAVAIVFGGTLVWRRAFVALRARRIDMNVLMSIAVLGAALIGEWGEGATVFFLYAVGGLLESRSLERTRRSIRDLMDLTPAVARVERAGSVTDVPVSGVLVGDTFLVRPGERVPLDGVVADGSSALDEAPITGESAPVDKEPGDAVYAGSLNTSGLLSVRASALAADSTLARVVHLVEEAQASRAPSQRLVDRFSAVYTPVVVALAVAMAVVPPAASALLGLGWGSFAEWFSRALVMLVVACPCALVISTPVSIVSGITRASRDGVLVKGGAFLETAAKVRAIAFDKTGTLTCGSPEVQSVRAYGGRDRADVLAVAGALETHSAHPVAQAVVRAAGAAAHPGEVSGFAEESGRGVRGAIGGVEYRAVSPAVAEGLGCMDETARADLEAEEREGRTVLVVLADGCPAGLVAVADAVRPETASAVRRVRKLGIDHLVMLTGDNERVAEAVAERVGITGFLARLLPEAKTDAVRALKDRYGTVAMVGDGVNDAPALAAADLGIAMGAAGSDTALETADVALMADDLSALPRFFELGRRTARVIRQNVAFSVVVKFAVLGLALAGAATLWMAVFADMGVSLLVILNGMRLLRRPVG